MKFRYVGPFDAVDLTVQVPRGAEVEIPETNLLPDGTTLVDSLLSQAGFWEVVDDGADLERLTIPQLRLVAAARDVDLTGLSLKAEILTALDNTTPEA